MMNRFRFYRRLPMKPNLEAMTRVERIREIIKGVEVPTPDGMDAFFEEKELRARGMFFTNKVEDAIRELKHSGYHHTKFYDSDLVDLFVELFSSKGWHVKLNRHHERHFGYVVIEITKYREFP